MRVVFAGTPAFAVPHLAAILAAPVGCIAVYTQPDRPAGRGRQLQASPVKAYAQAAGLPVLQPESMKTPEAADTLRALKPDLMVVVAYGQILPQHILDIPTHGCWNVHASLLPRWRGAAPIQRAILAGDRETGVALMQLERGLDTGPVIATLRCAVGDQTSAQLHDTLAVLGARVLRLGLDQLLANGTVNASPQTTQGLTYASKIDKAEAVLDLSADAPSLVRKVRAFDPWPIAEMQCAGERLRIHVATAIEGPENNAPGQLLALGPDGLDVACGRGVLRLQRVQRDGGKVVDAADYARSRQLPVG